MCKEIQDTPPSPLAVLLEAKTGRQGFGTQSGEKAEQCGALGKWAGGHCWSRHYPVRTCPTWLLLSSVWRWG